MSLPITLAVFLDLPDKIKTDKAMCWVLMGLGALGSWGLVRLFKIDYFSLVPADYGVQIDAALARESLFAAQFHPEKSDTAGLRLLRNFLSWSGEAG